MGFYIQFRVWTKCESSTFDSYQCSFSFARPDTYSHPLPKELWGGWFVQRAGQLLRPRRWWQESKEPCKTGLMLMILSVFFVCVWCVWLFVYLSGEDIGIFQTALNFLTSFPLTSNGHVVKNYCLQKFLLYVHCLSLQHVVTATFE